MLKLKRNMLFMALASATLMVSAGAYAQTADTSQDSTLTAKERDAKRKAEAAEKAKQMDVVEVSGIRRGIESAISIKQENTSIVEAISAEDIGKLPDSSIAESIARLPGLAAQRVAGRASTISIRGLAGDFSTTLLNGREQVSSGDNRSVEFDQYPSELVSQVLVYKTPDAQLIGQGLSGTVDLKTVRPLAYGKRAFAANLRLDQQRLGLVLRNHHLHPRHLRHHAQDAVIQMAKAGIAGDAVAQLFGLAHVENRPRRIDHFINAWRGGKRGQRRAQ